MASKENEEKIFSLNPILRLFLLDYQLLYLLILKVIMLQKILAQIEKERSVYNESMQSKCLIEKIKNLQKVFFGVSKMELPTGYLDFLQIMDGLDWNGVTIYASKTSLIDGYSDRYIQGVIEANSIYSKFKFHKDLIFLGESGMDTYVYSTDTCQYQIIERVSLDVIQIFQSFDLMLTQILQDLL